MSKREKGGLSLFQKIGYGVGDLGGNFCWTFVATFLMFYCTNVLGISSAIVGTLIAVSKILDGFTDIIMGAILDRTHSKMGKSRFWMLVSTFPLAICTYLIFNVPASFTENTKYVYIFIVYTLMGAIFYTMNTIAYSSLMALCTKNPKDRVQMGSFRYIFAIIAGVAIQSVTTGMVESFGGGQQGWRMVSLIFAVLCCVVLLIPILSVKELTPEELGMPTKKEEAKEEEKIGFGETFKLMIHNKYFILILIYYFVMYLTSMASSGLGVYYATYVLNQPALLGSIALCSYVPTIIMLFFVDKITAKFGIRKSAFYGHCVAFVGTLICLIGGLNGSVASVLAGYFIRGIGMAPMSGSVNALIAATDDYSELKTGRRMTGTFFACSSVGIKVGSGLGTALGGILLEACHYDGMAAVQSAATITTIKWAYLFPNVLFPLATIIILSMMDVEDQITKIRREKGLID